jgi:hypothetical protein
VTFDRFLNQISTKRVGRARRPQASRRLIRPTANERVRELSTGSGGIRKFPKAKLAVALSAINAPRIEHRFMESIGFLSVFHPCFIRGSRFRRFLRSLIPGHSFLTPEA